MHTIATSVDDSFQRMRDKLEAERSALTTLWIRISIALTSCMSRNSSISFSKAGFTPCTPAKFLLRETTSSSRLARTRSLWRGPSRAISRLCIIFAGTAAPASVKKRAVIAEPTFVPTTAGFTTSTAHSKPRAKRMSCLTLMQQRMA